MFAIKYKPTGQYTNLTFKGIDAINLGVNPKIYKDEESAQRDLDKIETAFDQMKQSNYNGRRTFERNLINLERKNVVKVNATRSKNILFYKMKLEQIIKQEKEVELYKVEDFGVVCI
jgi:hypothetical protein